MARATTPKSDAAPPSQTLSRGLTILEILADAGGPLAIDEIAAELGVHRSIAYRLLRTLEEHGLVVRDGAGRMQLGARMAALAAGAARDLQAEALPELTAVANELGMTCFLGVLDRDECITLASVEPRHAVASVAQRPGSRHAVTVGAPGKAIISLLPEDERPPLTAALRAEVEESLRTGYTTSHDEVLPTVQAVAVPLSLRRHRPAAIAVVYVGPTQDPARLAERLHLSVAAIRDALGD